MKQIGRNIIQEEQTKYAVELSLTSKVIKAYYVFRIKLIERRKEKFAAAEGGYKVDLFNSCVYMKQSYLYKVEALYSRQELRDFERRRKKIYKN